MDTGMQTASEVEAAAALAANQAAGEAAPAAAAEIESAAPPPVRRGPPSSHRGYPQTTASACSHPVVDDGPHGRRRPAIRHAAHAHAR